MACKPVHLLVSGRSVDKLTVQFTNVIGYVKSVLFKYNATTPNSYIFEVTNSGSTIEVVLSNLHFSTAYSVEVYFMGEGRNSSLQHQFVESTTQLDLLM